MVGGGRRGGRGRAGRGGGHSDSSADKTGDLIRGGGLGDSLLLLLSLDWPMMRFRAESINLPAHRAASQAAQWTRRLIYDSQ